MYLRIKDYVLRNYRTVTVLYLLIAVVATLQLGLGHRKVFEQDPYHIYTRYNNYVIFKQSYFHLIEGKDLYKLYSGEHWDLYKYSPTFALLFAPFSYLPDIIGLLGWNLLNVFCLFFAFKLLPQLDDKAKVKMLLFVLIELLTSIQNSQSNALMAGLLIVSFALLEKKNYFLATLCIALTVYIKIFGVVAFALLLFYPDKWKSIVYSITNMILLFLLPLLVVSHEQLIFLYKSWGALLTNDHSASIGISVMGWLQTWFHLAVNKNVLVLVGILISCFAFLKWKQFSDYGFRIAILSAILIWIVIFNHKAESPTFIIAISGVALWYFSRARNVADTILVIVAFVFTSLSPTDIFPNYIQDNFFDPYVVKAVPCILIWIKIMVESLTWNKEANLQSA